MFSEEACRLVTMVMMFMMMMVLKSFAFKESCCCRFQEACRLIIIIVNRDYDDGHGVYVDVGGFQIFYF